MRPLLAGLGAFLLLLGVLFGYVPQLTGAGGQQVYCNTSSFNSVTFTGYVTDASTSSPLSNARVNLHDAQSPSVDPFLAALTNYAGYYAISWSPGYSGIISGCDQMTLTATMTGYTTTTVNFAMPDWNMVPWTPPPFGNQGTCNAQPGSCTKNPSVNTNAAMPAVTPLVASFSYKATNLAVAFMDSSTGTPTSWAWNFGDGSTATTSTPSHTYASSGNYTVTLTVRRASDFASSSASTKLGVSTSSNPAGSVTCTTNCAPTNSTSPPPPTNRTKTFNWGNWNANFASIGFLIVGGTLMLTGVAIPGGRKK